VRVRVSVRSRATGRVRDFTRTATLRVVKRD
jgi:hypothetical protein